MATKVLLPECIYSGSSIPEILRLYEQRLHAEKTPKGLLHAVAIHNYCSQITDKRFLSIIRKNFDLLYGTSEEIHPDLRFRIEGRRKSLISSDEKITRLISENRSSDQFRDAYAFRIILWDENYHKDDVTASTSIMKKCYEIMNDIIKLFITKDFVPCESSPVVDIMSPGEARAKSIIIPDESGILPEYRNSVKDYILNPKKNGYQSLHTAFRTPSGYCFEVQVRNLDMHSRAENGTADHTSYKENRYAYRVNFDRKRVRLPGYEVSEDGTLHFDFVGLEEPVILFRRQKTF